MPTNKGPITIGYDFNFFDKVTVTKTTFLDDGYATDADVVLTFRGSSKTLLLLNEGSETVEYSFNGRTLHGDLIPGTPSAAIAYDNRAVTKIWFRVSSGSTIVRVEAWAIA